MRLSEAGKRVPTSWGRWGVAALTVTATLQIARVALGGSGALEASPGTLPSWPPDTALEAFRNADVYPPGTVVLAFHPECVHGPLVTREWAAWIDRIRDSGDDVRLVTRAPETEGRRYARSVGWHGSVHTAAAGEPEAGIAGRTPWIFVVGHGGELAFDGHGTRWKEAEVARLEVIRRPTTVEGR